MLFLRALISLAMLGGAAAMLPKADARVAEFTSWFARPARLPFAWQALTAADRGGDGSEAFARGQQILDLVPSWTLGHAAFAYRYVLTQDARGTAATVAAQAERRLVVAMAWLERARQHAGDRELELLLSAAFLAPIACRSFPGLDALLPPGGAAAITDAYYAEAERLFPTAAVREQRLFHTPTLAAALLDAGERQAAIELLQQASARSAQTRDQQLASEWRARVDEAIGLLQGERRSRDAVLYDPRFEPLRRHLR